MLKKIPIVWKLSAIFIAILFFFLAAMSYIITLIDERYIVLSTAIAIVLGCAVTWWMVNRLLNDPIRDLIEAMNNLAEKNFDFRLDESRNDEFGRLAVSFNDMTSMLSASLTELKRARDHLEGTLEGSADIIITVNTSGNILTVNTGAENALGYKRHEVIGKPVEILFDDPREREIAVEKLEHTDNVVNYETRFVTKSGEVRDVLLTLTRLKNPAGATVGTFGISKDITEEKRLQHELIQSQRLAAIGEVFTGIQHSIKNMLNAMKGGAYMVRIGLAKDKRKMLEEGWEMVQEGIEKMTEMSMNMLKHVKDWKPELARVDLTVPLSEIDNVIRQTAMDKGVEFKLDFSPDLTPVLCDAHMIHTAVMDIVSNALDACLNKEYHDGETPEVVVSAYPDPNGEESVIKIKDNGCGMSKEVQADIFKPFFSTKSRTGTGLGLSITSRIIGVHGGKIEVESEPDCGAEFRIVLPVDGSEKNKE